MDINEVKKLLGKRVLIEELDYWFFGIIPDTTTHPYECVIMDVIDKEDIVKLKANGNPYYRKVENIRILKVLD